MKALLNLLYGTIFGSMVTLGAVQFAQSRAKPILNPQPAAQPFTATLYRYELNPDKLSRFEDWVRFERAHYAETVATLGREKMYFEVIFRDREHEKNVIYWLAIQGQGGGHTDDSPLPIDKQYQQFMRDALKKGSGTALSTEYLLVPQFMVDAIQHHSQSF